MLINCLVENKNKTGAQVNFIRVKKYVVTNAI
jgi:hypothetical protein